MRREIAIRRMKRVSPTSTRSRTSADKLRLVEKDGAHVTPFHSRPESKN